MKWKINVLEMYQNHTVGNESLGTSKKWANAGSNIKSVWKRKILKSPKSVEKAVVFYRFQETSLVKYCDVLKSTPFKIYSSYRPSHNIQAYLNYNILELKNGGHFHKNWLIQLTYINLKLKISLFMF